MGRGHGDTKSQRIKENSSVYIGAIEEIETLKNIEDPEVYKAMKEAISRYHAELGVRERNVKLAKMDADIDGLHTEGAVYLNSRYFKKSSLKEITAREARSYEIGHLTRTNKPVAHTITHELAHATWNSHMAGERQKAAGKEIYKVFKQWYFDRKKTGYGTYARTNRDEFFAETVSKAVHGKADKYTVAIKGIIKKYGL